MRTATASAALKSGSAVLTCSALKKSYRAVLRDLPAGERERIRVHFVYLSLDPEELVRRVEARVGHYMKAEMVRSQLEVLEVPDGEERGLDSVVIEAGRELGVVQREVKGAFEEVMGRDEVVANGA